jgi:hypothetical protein
MNIWNMYQIENLRRQEETERAALYRITQKPEAAYESRLTKISIRMLDIVGTKLVQWGSQLQCRRAELSLTNSKRAI